MKVGIIIQARMGSSRLPGKVLMNVDERNELLGFLYKRLKKSEYAEIIVVATSDTESDNAIEFLL